MMPYFHKKIVSFLLSFFPRGEEYKDFWSKDVSNKIIENNIFKELQHYHNIKDI